MPSYYIDHNTGQRVAIKKTHRFRNFIVIPAASVFAVLALVGIVSAATTPAPAGSSSSVTPAASAGGASTVEITGSGEAMVSVTTGGTSTNTVQLPHTVELPEGFVSVSVTRSPSVESYMNGKKDTGEVSCRIIRDGEVIDEQKASGEFAAVNCSKWR